MLYFDNDYILDCKYKIDYNNIMSYTSDGSHFPNLSESIKYYSCDNSTSHNIIIAKININSDEFWVKDVAFCKEIAPNIFKIVISDEITK